MLVSVPHPSRGVPERDRDTEVVTAFELLTTNPLAHAPPTRNWVETVQVKEKTAQRIVSWDEWRRIKRGMTVDRLRQIVGYSGPVYRYGYGGLSNRRYDMMAFWRFSIVEYRDGRVVSKLWNAAHD